MENVALIGNKSAGEIYTMINCIPVGSIYIIDSHNVLVSNIVMQKPASHDNIVANLQIVYFHSVSYPYLIDVVPMSFLHL